jgi:hypothetical protein
MNLVAGGMGHELVHNCKAVVACSSYEEDGCGRGRHHGSLKFFVWCNEKDRLRKNGALKIVLLFPSHIELL